MTASSRPHANASAIVSQRWPREEAAAPAFGVRWRSYRPPVSLIARSLRERPAYLGTLGCAVSGVCSSVGCSASIATRSASESSGSMLRKQGRRAVRGVNYARASSGRPSARCPVDRSGVGGGHVALETGRRRCAIDVPCAHLQARTREGRVAIEARVSQCESDSSALARLIRQLRLAMFSKLSAVATPSRTRSHVGLCPNTSTTIQRSAIEGIGSRAQRRK